MSQIELFIKELEDQDSVMSTYFSNKKMLIESLRELDNVIGMRKIKTQVLKQIKTFVSAKAKRIYQDKDRKHCLLCGPPGCGKTTVAKILCKIWIAIGFIGNSGGNKKINTFNQLQDELIRKQRNDIKQYKEKLNLCNKVVLNMKRVSTISKRTLNNVIKTKDSVNHKTYGELYGDLTGMVNIIENCDELMKDINVIKSEDFKGMELDIIDKEMVKTNEDVDLPFYVYNRNDVVSRYVGDTAHRCTKAMNDALGGVAYFDEAYNLCNDTHGLSDSYGRVALTTINQYMDTFSDRLIVVFSGYKEDIYNNLFKVQRGLESRFTQKFDIEAYNPEEMTKIYIQRLSKSGWIISETPELVNIIRENFSMFKYHGRDMDTLAMYTKNVVSEKIYEDVITGNKIGNVITDLNIVRNAISIFKENTIEHTDTKSDLERLVDSLRG